MLELEQKFCRVSEGASGHMTVTDGSVISGYASLFGQVDQGGDVVEAGAYRASLERLKVSGGSVKMLWQHDPTQPIGIWDEVREDHHGLWVRGRVLTDVEKGREAVALLDAKALDGLSIGYRTVRSHKGAEGRRHLDELELWEVSLVTFPMLPSARVGGKGDDPVGAHLRELASVFDHARLSLNSE